MRIRKVTVLVTVLLLLLTVPAFASSTTNTNTFTFLSNSINAAQTGSGYEISGTALTITAAGTYTITGTCNNGSITVKKDVTGVTLNLRDLSLASSTTAPLICGKNSAVKLNVSNAVTLTDSEDASSADSEGAAIKVKSDASLVITGSGTLTANGSACKNGIKGAENAEITVRGGVTLVVKAANNGIASDGSVIFDGGTTTVTAVNDGIKSEPEEDDTNSAGTVQFNAGTVTVSAGDDAVQATNGVTISGGTLNFTSVGNGVTSKGDVTVTDGDITIKTTGTKGDGIQTSANLDISGGTFDITTFNGYTNIRSLGDGSAKGLKASPSATNTTSTTDDTNTANNTSDADEPTNTITISGGSFTFNTADDAIHCDNDITITGGQFQIQTGDDGVHADNILTLGETNGVDPALQLTITNSYEGLEGSVVNILSGCYDVTSSDDGINAAGGSSSGYDPGGPMGPGGPGGRGNSRPFALSLLSADDNGGDTQALNADFPQSTGRDDFPQSAGRDGFPQSTGRDGFPQSNGRDGFPQSDGQRAGRGGFQRGGNMDQRGDMAPSNNNNGFGDMQQPRDGGNMDQRGGDMDPSNNNGFGDIQQPRDGGERATLSANSAYAINISGGVVIVNANGDGLDANGNINLTGGHITVWGQQAGYDNEPLDYDGALVVRGAYVFAAGGSGMGVANPTNSQLYTSYRSSNIASGKTINVKDANNNIVCSVRAVKNVNYVFFSSPDVVNGWTISAGNTTPVTDCDILGHAWNSGTVTKEASCTTDGTMVYTCTVCGETETVTLPETGHHYVAGTCTRCGETDPNADDDIETVSGYTVAFSTDGHASVAVYKTQTISASTLDSSGTYYARHGETGQVIVNGNGQSNFVVTVADGYTLRTVTVYPESAYGSLQLIDADTNTYRVTNIRADITVTVTTAVVVSKAGFFYTPGEESTAVQLGYEKVDGVKANTKYFAAFGWFDDAGQLIDCYIVPELTLDADKYAELSLTFPETFSRCAVFLLDSAHVPQCKAQTLQSASQTLQGAWT